MSVPSFSQAASGNPEQVIPGITQRFYDNVETNGRWTTVKHAMDDLQSMGRAGHSMAQKLQGMVQKAVGIGDIGAVRLVSLSTEVYKVYNPDTTFLDLINGRRLNSVTDFTHGWKEDDYGAASLASMAFDPNGVPAEDNAASVRRTNTLMAIGGLVNVGIVTNEMVKKRGFMDEIDRQITDKLVKLKKAENYFFINGVENTSGPVYQMGSLVSRSVNNGVTGAGNTSAIVRANLDTAIQNIITAVGVRELAIVGLPSTLADIMAMLQVQFPGSRVSDFPMYSNVQKDRLTTVYYSSSAGPVPCYLDVQMPANTLAVVCLDLLRPNGFTIGDMAGPFIIALAQTGMSEPKLVFDLVTLEDPVINARSLITSIR